MIYLDLRSIKEFIKDTIGYILVIVAVIILVVYVITLQQVVGSSMEPELQANDVLLLNKIHYKIFDIKRNDIIAFSSNSKLLIKRVIGLPGETISYKNNILYIDGSPHSDEYGNDFMTYDFELSYLGYDKIPEDMYFVLGDNREKSEDSRKFGLIKKADIVGKTFIKIWPLNKIKVLN